MNIDLRAGLNPNPVNATAICHNHNLFFSNDFLEKCIRFFEMQIPIKEAMDETFNPLEQLGIHILITQYEFVTGEKVFKKESKLKK